MDYRKHVEKIMSVCTCFPGTSGKLTDQARNKLHRLLKQFELTITPEVNHQIVNVLDIKLGLATDPIEKETANNFI